MMAIGLSGRVLCIGITLFVYACICVLLPSSAMAQSSAIHLPLHTPLHIPIPINTKLHWAFEQGLEDNLSLRVKAENTNTQSTRILIRIDHDLSHDYYSRFNREQLQNPGIFTFTIPLDQLVDSNGKKIKPEKIRHIYLVALKGNIKWHSVDLVENKHLPKGLIAWDFGPIDQHLSSGFIPIDPRNSAISGQTRVRDRPYYDAMLKDGLEGMHRITLPIPNGLWKVRLWVNDIGEWEYLPHSLNRRILLNSKEVLADKLTAKQWLERFYLNRPKLLLPDVLELPEELPNTQNHAVHAKRLVQFQKDFWQQMASKRGRMLEFELEVTQKALVLDFFSPSPEGRFISALVAEPINKSANNGQNNQQSKSLFDEFNQQRQQHFLQSWPVVANPELFKNLPPLYQGETLLWAKGEEITLRLKVPRTLGSLKKIQLPLHNIKFFRLTPQLRRVGGQENALQPQLYLHPIETGLGNEKATRINTQQPSSLDQSPYEHWIVTGQVKKDLNPLNPLEDLGLVFQKGAIKINIETLELTLPPINKPIGIYLDYAPHLTWFDKDKKPSNSNQQAEKQAHCDYQFLYQFGLTGVAPALPTPLLKNMTQFKRAAQAPLLSGLKPPFPAYTPIKRLLRHYSEQTKSQDIAFNNLLKPLKKTQSLWPMMLWSLADEPGETLAHGIYAQNQALSQLNQLLAQTLPDLKRIAQLNKKIHSRLVEVFDAVLINHGYQLTERRLQDLREKNVDVYLYNLPHLRFSVGSYLWRIKGKGFWQWHGRMPTAHPFDPTDGREDDVQLLLPNTKVCSLPAIHSGLLAIRQGINDHRWLNWLVKNANTHIDSAILLAKIHQAVSQDFHKGYPNSDNIIEGVIKKIKKIALNQR